MSYCRVCCMKARRTKSGRWPRSCFSCLSLEGPPKKEELSMSKAAVQTHKSNMSEPVIKPEEPRGITKILTWQPRIVFSWSHTYNNSQQKRSQKGSNLQKKTWTTKNASNPGGFSQMAFSTEVVVPAMPTDFVPFRRRKSLGDAESSWAPKWRRVALRPPDSALVFGTKKWRWVWWSVWWVPVGSQVCDNISML